MNHSYHGRERSDSNLRSRFEDFIQDEKKALKSRARNLNESEIKQIGNKAIAFVKENPDVVLGALIAVGAASFTAIKILALTDRNEPFFKH